MDKDEFYHHGVKGQRWGVRRTSEQLTRTKSNVDSASSMVREAKNINNSVNGIRSISGKKDFSHLSDNELREKVARMNLEQQYSNLSSNNISRGQAYAKSTLEVAGSVLAIGSSALGIALAIKQLKG